MQLKDPNLKEEKEEKEAKEEKIATKKQIKTELISQGQQGPQESIFVEMPQYLHYRLINGGGVVLITTRYSGKDNVLPVAWNVALSSNPPLIGISISPLRFSHDLIKKSNCFGISIPTNEIINQVYSCGKISGKDVDKFSEFKLDKFQAKKIDCPLVLQGCIGYIECKVKSSVVQGDHTLFVGEVALVYHFQAILNPKQCLNINLNTCKVLHHLGGSSFYIPSGDIEYAKDLNKKEIIKKE